MRKSEPTVHDLRVEIVILLVFVLLLIPAVFLAFDLLEAVGLVRR